MARIRIWFAVLAFALVAAMSANADYNAGNRAWQSGHPVEALKQWQAAANAGDSRAMLALGRLYLKGLGAPQDFVLAHMWFNLAASRGETGAIRHRDVLSARMTSTERAEAQKRARAWRPESEAAQPATTEERRSRAGQSPAPSPPPRAIREAQRLLTALGYVPGPVDGIWGDRAARAYGAFLRDSGQPVADRLSPHGLRALRATMAARKTNARRPPPSRKRAEPRDLFRAVRDGDIDGTRAILETGVNPNVRDNRGWTPLMYAANDGYKSLVPRLIEARADPDLRAADGATALFVAVLRGHAEIAELLVRAGANVSIRGPGGRTPADVARLRKLTSTSALLKRADSDHAAFLAARKSDTAEAYKRYLVSNPRGLFVEQARQRRDERLDGNAFARAKRIGTARAHRDYLAAHPEGRHRDAAEQRATELDSEEFERAVKANTAAAYRNYLAANPKGMFVEEAKRRRDASFDREAFSIAKARHTIDAYKAYLASHPKGSHAQQAKMAVKHLKDPIVFARARSMNTLEAYDEYLSLYPDGLHAEEARRHRDQVDAVGREFRDCENCPAMVVLPPGSFNMGSTGGEMDERPQHRVTIAEPFAVGKYEVTFGEFEAFVRETRHDMAENRKGFLGLPAAEACSSQRRFIDSSISWRDPGYPQEDRSPAVCVNWNDANAYVKWLSRKTGKPYRLLSEAEWEYAARATTTGAFHFGETISTDQANYNNLHDGGSSAGSANRRRALKVGSFASNEFGLHEMHGNVLEWVEDCWHDDYVGAPVDGRAWTVGGDCTIRVARGGSWFNPAGYLRSAFRNGMEANKRFTHFGFRIARPITAKALLTKLGSSPKQE